VARDRRGTSEQEHPVVPGGSAPVMAHRQGATNWRGVDPDVSQVRRPAGIGPGSHPVERRVLLLPRDRSPQRRSPNRICRQFGIRFVQTIRGIKRKKYVRIVF